jgi:hypothetical protein
MESHLFYLPQKVDEQQVSRLALGPLMPSEYRRTFPVFVNSPELGTKTGTVGFMDFIDRRVTLPQSISNRGIVDVISVMTVGIEPGYQGKEYFRVMHDELVRLALEEHKDGLMFVSLGNKDLKRKLIVKYDYVPLSEKEVVKMLK